jgi:4-diphosphocytidyl-2-C-methyl-D-erythritol kinase
VNRVTVQAPAKINLGLYVLGKRPDGYHEIESVLQMVSLYDDLIIEEGEKGIQVLADHESLPAVKENLVYRAAELLSREGSKSPSIRIRLVKRIPVAAGLGGGSSDAAATLLGLNRLWGLHYSREHLMEIGCTLGMDVPFFLSTSTALARGRGEILEPLSPPSPPIWVLLINPGVEVSTEWVYQGLNLGLTIENKHISIRKFSLSAVRGAGLENDLERVTVMEYPMLQEIKETLKKWGAEVALMTGSGPTLFGLFPDRGRALTARKELVKRKDLSVFLVHTLETLP